MELLNLVCEANRHLLGPEQGMWLDRLDRRREKLHRFLEQCIQSNEPENALTLAGALSQFWWMRGHTPYGQEQIKRALALVGGSDKARASALIGAGSLAYAAGEFHQARTHYETALPMLTEDQQQERAHALDRAGMAARQLMDLADAHRFHLQALKIQQQKDAPAERALCLNNLGVVAFFQGDLKAAQEYHLESLELREQSGDVRGQASSLNNLGLVARFSGNYEEALHRMESSLKHRQNLEDHWGVAGSLVNLAAVRAHLNDTDRARADLSHAISGFQSVGDPLGICECLESAAEIAHVEGHLEQAVQLLSAANARRQALPAPASPMLNKALQEQLTELKSEMEANAYDTAWRQGVTAGDSLISSFLP